MDHDAAINHTQQGNKNKLLITVGIIVIVILGAIVMVKKGSFIGMGGNKPTQSPENSMKKGGKMYLASISGSHTFPVNEEFSLDLRIDTNSQEVGGYDAVMFYDSNLLEFVKVENLVPDFELFTNESQVPGETSTTRLTITGIMQLEKQKPFAFNQEPVAHIVFRAKKAGSSTIKFDFTQGETSDSNLVLINTDEILSEVTNFTIVTGASHILKIGQTYTDSSTKVSAKLVKIITPEKNCNDCMIDAQLEITSASGEKQTSTFSNGGFAGKISDSKNMYKVSIEISNITEQSIDISIIPE